LMPSRKDRNTFTYGYMSDMVLMELVLYTSVLKDGE